ncbi:serine/threonine protein phosphatase 2A 57 kDa regulatory subunit B' kappa isoform [Punica granatum]|uniref:Serine/threonine protein phosphatase 2A regulatory subunit n=2 Tax=Punica granatum TaxID=22663 RepID=A0A218XVP4_PUNGR|nr:serine/threonine protein phosphatase 2A 57 kDa regulatory subunit B' kappa isoform [Punica granatum]OWM89117.1 hypothetical protein CDL15_Pgr026280 [Punica granatum]PKI40031.1 hypothetical protein CRG98_039601 [Punica granatum]
MLKQFLSKLPRRAAKVDSSDSAHSPDAAHKSNGRSPASASRSTGPKRASAAVFPASVIGGIEPLMPFKDVSISEEMSLFVSKLSLCCVTFDFTDPTKNTMEKDVKRQILIELADFVSSGSVRFTEPAILAMCRMCAVNLFRVFPPKSRPKLAAASSGENDNEDDPVFYPAWSHLQLVYEILLKFVTSSCLDAKIAKKYIEHSFILRLLDLFDSDDPRERECLKTILHRIYGKFMVHRPFIRKAISNIFYRFVFETEKHNGIAELLEIFGSVISGFTLPLKEEHRIFLSRVLIPLHKPKSLGVYFQQLSYCVTQFIDKDPRLTSVVVGGILKYWPVTNSQKEVMFLGEIEEILENINMAEFQMIMVPLFWRIGCCINSLHFQVAERALFLWNNEQIVGLVAYNRHEIVPIVLPALERNAHDHWNQSVLNLSLSVRKMLLDMDEVLFLSCLAHSQEEQERMRREAERRNEAWARVESAATRQPLVGNIAVLVTPLAASISC